MSVVVPCGVQDGSSPGGGVLGRGDDVSQES